MHQSKPLAAAGLDSYRYRLAFSYVMIGAHNPKDALVQASRSIREAPNITCLEKWNGQQYVPIVEKAELMTITVVNVKGLRGEQRDGIVYVGREFAGWEESPLSNRAYQKLRRFPDDTPITMYRRWLWQEVRRNNSHVLDELHR
ncbi:MAG: hypothetical protein AAF512_17665, partial [Pseudomonadota bacterium]